MRGGWTFWLPLALFAGFVGLVAMQLYRPAEREVQSAMIGKPIPNFVLRAAVPDRPGVATADLTDGKPHLLNIWASWCVPCAAEAPQLEALRRQGAETIEGRC